MIGQKLGNCRIVEKIGAGGMGEVYRARDERLGRDVAIKILPQGFANDPERIARFEREARLLASLNHPNIAQIHGFEESDGTRFLLLELVEGETLARRLNTGALPVDEALPVIKQIAEALEYAHEHGVLHRDLKPANIKVTPEGKVKVLDFGLAKAFTADSSSPDISGSPTMSEAATRAGVLLGTAAYMSPEQARCKPLDKRTDIWSFGCVLYEALAGRPAFPGETATDCFAGILKGEPDWNTLPPNTPAPLRSLLRRCLQKDPARRLRDMGDARIEIEESLSAPAAAEAARTPGASRRSIALWCLAGLITGALTTAAVLWPRPSREARPAMRFNVVTNFAGVETSPSLSPDGRSVALISNRDGQYDIYVVLVSGGSMVRITNEPNMKTRPRWSPDGARIAYARLNDWGQWDIWVVPALGGTPRKLLSNATDPAWSPDGSTLAYSDVATGTLWLCDANGSNARALTKAEERLHRQPVFSRDGGEMAFVRRAAGPRGEIAVINLTTGHIRQLTQDGTLTHSPVWSPKGEFIYFASSRGGTTNIWRISPAGGEPEQVTAGQGDDAELDLSLDGNRVVFSTVRQDMNLVEVMLDAPGKVRQLTFDAARGETQPDYSPDGQSIAYFSYRKGAENESVWVMRADGSHPVQLAFDEMINAYPKWMSDGQAVIYVARTRAMSESWEFRRLLVSGGRPETLGEYTFKDSSSARVGGQRIDVGPDGRIAFLDGNVRIWDPKTKQAQALAEVRGRDPRWSPSGRFIAYRLEPREAGDAQAGLWVYNFEDAPRQLFRGWVVRAVWASEDELIVVEGKANMKAPVWRVYADGRAPVRTPTTLQLVHSYIVLSFGATVELDAHPDRRRIVVSHVQDEADIGMIENIR